MKAPRLFVICLLFTCVTALASPVWVMAQTSDPADLEVGGWIEKNIPLYIDLFIGRYCYHKVD